MRFNPNLHIAVNDRLDNEPLTNMVLIELVVSY